MLSKSTSFSATFFSVRVAIFAPQDASLAIAAASVPRERVARAGLFRGENSLLAVTAVGDSNNDIEEGGGNDATDTPAAAEGEGGMDEDNVSVPRSDEKEVTRQLLRRFRALTSSCATFSAFSLFDGIDNDLRDLPLEATVVLISDDEGPEKLRVC